MSDWIIICIGYWKFNNFEKKELKKKVYPSFVSGKEDEDGQINKFNNESNSINGNYQDAIRMNEGHSIEYPKHAI